MLPSFSMLLGSRGRLSAADVCRHSCEPAGTSWAVPGEDLRPPQNSGVSAVLCALLNGHVDESLLSPEPVRRAEGGGLPDSCLMSSSVRTST